MGGGVSTSAGATIFIGTTAADGTTDSYVEVAEITTIPEFGRVYKEVTFNPIKTRGTQKFKGSFDDGSIAVALGKDSSDAGQAACIVALDVDADYNFKIVANDAAPEATATVSMATGTPGHVTDTGHGLVANTGVKFAGGTLISGLTAGTTYYIKDVVDEDTYTVSATKGGSAINFVASPAQSGTHTRTTVPAPTSQMMKAKVMSYTTKYDSLDNVIMSTMSLSIKSGSIVETARLPAPADVDA